MTVFPTQADERLRRVLSWANGDGSKLRTHLDEWAAFHYGGDLLTSGMRQRWFNNPCPLTNGRRLLKHMDVFSPMAQEICRKGEQGDATVKKPKRGQQAPYRLMVDHAVPVTVLGVDVRSNAQLVEPTKLREFLIKFFRRGVITYDENGALDRVGLRQRMPDGWQFGDDVYARYKSVGIAIASPKLSK